MMRTTVAEGSGTARRVLVIGEDDPATSSAFSYAIQAAGYQVQTAASGRAGLELCEAFRPDLVLLDIEIPDISGLEVCRQIRASTDIPQPAIIIVTARNQESDRIAGFGMGADDFVPKPFSLSELLLRIRARLSSRPTQHVPSTRPQRNDDQDHGRINLGPLQIDKASHRVFLLDKQLNLSVQEMRLLSYLASEPGKMRTRRELLTAVWGYHPEAVSRTLDTHIKRLRDKFGPLAAMIQTAHGVGYRLTLSPVCSPRALRPASTDSGRPRR